MSQQVTITITARDGASQTFQAVGKAAAGMSSSAQAAATKSNAALNSVSKAAATTEQSVGRISRGFDLVTGAAAGLIGSAVTGFLSDAARAAADAEAVMASLTATVEASGGSMAEFGPAIEAAMASAEGLAFDGEVAAQALGILTQQTGSTEEALSLLSLTMDVARGRGIDLSTAANAVGRAAAGQTGALQRMGVALDEGASAQEALTKASETFAGQADSYADTTQGAFDRFAVSIGNVQENIGGMLGPMQTVIGLLPGVSSGFGLAASAAGALSSAGGLGGVLALMNPLGLAIGAAALAVGGLTLALTYTSEAAGKAKEQYKLLDEALTAQGVDEATQKYIDNALNVVDYADRVSIAVTDLVNSGQMSGEFAEQYRLSGEEVARTSGNISEAIAATGAAAIDTAKVFSNGDNGLLPAYSSLKLTGEELNKVASDTITIFGDQSAAGLEAQESALKLFELYNTGEITTRDLLAGVNDLNVGLAEQAVVASASGDSISQYEQDIIDAILNTGAAYDKYGGFMESEAKANDVRMKAAVQAEKDRAAAVDQAARDAAAAREEEAREAEAAGQKIIDAARETEKDVVAAAEAEADGVIEARERAARESLRAIESSGKAAVKAAEEAGDARVREATRIENKTVMAAEAAADARVTAAEEAEERIVSAAEAAADDRIAQAERAEEAVVAAAERAATAQIREAEAAARAASRVIEEALRQAERDAEQIVQTATRAADEAEAAANAAAEEEYNDKTERANRHYDQAVRKAERSGDEITRREQQRLNRLEKDRDAIIESAEAERRQREEEAARERERMIREAEQRAQAIRREAQRTAAIREREINRNLELAKRRAAAQTEAAAQAAAERTAAVQEEQAATVAAAREAAAQQTAAVIEQANQSVEIAAREAARATEQVRREAVKGVRAEERETAREIREVNRQTAQVQREQARSVAAATEAAADDRIAAEERVQAELARLSGQTVTVGVNVELDTETAGRALAGRGLPSSERDGLTVPVAVVGDQTEFDATMETVAEDALALEEDPVVVMITANRAAFSTHIADVRTSAQETEDDPVVVTIAANRAQFDATMQAAERDAKAFESDLIMAQIAATTEQLDATLAKVRDTTVGSVFLEAVANLGTYNSTISALNGTTVATVNVKVNAQTDTRSQYRLVKVTGRTAGAAAEERSTTALPGTGLLAPAFPAVADMGGTVARAATTTTIASAGMEGGGGMRFYAPVHIHAASPDIAREIQRQMVTRSRA